MGEKAPFYVVVTSLFEKCLLDTRAEEARRAGVYPYFHRLASRQDVEVMMEGRRRMMLGSNNYLALTTHPEVVEAGRSALAKYGTGCSGSRFLNGTLDLHLELEAELADFLGKDEALTFGTGFQTNLGVISALVGRHDYLICDKEAHASVYSAAQMCLGKLLRFRHNDMTHLEAQLKAVPVGSGALVVVDGVFSLGGDLAQLPEICRLAHRYEAAVMVDDAHGLGVIGPGGRGSAHHFGLADEVDILMGTFSKSFASLGGYVAANRTIIDFLRHASAPFIFSAAIPPASAAVALAALRVLKSHPELPAKLRAISDYARTAYLRRGIPLKPGAETNLTPILPVLVGATRDTLVAAKRVFDAGVFTNPFIPPGVAEGEGLLRTSVMATHTPALIDAAADILAEALRC